MDEKSGTLNRHLSQLQEVLVYIEACGHKIPEFAGVSRLLSKKKGRARDERNPFSREDPIAIFQQPPWTGCKNLENRVVPGPHFYHDALSIVPYLARYTLARREELCGLDVDDALEEDGIPYIFIRPNEHRTLKTPQSRRRIPLVGEVVRLGFLRYRSEIKSLINSCFRSFVQQVIVRPWAMSSMATGSKFKKRLSQMPPKSARFFIRLEKPAARI